MTSHPQADCLPSSAASSLWAPTTALAFCPTPACSSHQEDVVTLPQPSLISGHPGLGQPGNPALAFTDYLGEPRPPLVTTGELLSNVTQARPGPAWGLGAGKALGEHKTVTSEFLGFTVKALFAWPSNTIPDLVPSGQPQGQAQLPNPLTARLEEATAT